MTQNFKAEQAMQFAKGLVYGLTLIYYLVVGGYILLVGGPLWAAALFPIIPALILSRILWLELATHPYIGEDLEPYFLAEEPENAK